MYTSKARCWKLPSFCTIKPHVTLCLLGWILPKEYWKMNAQNELVNVCVDSKKVVSFPYICYSVLITRNFWNFCAMLQRWGKLFGYPRSIFIVFLYPNVWRTGEWIEFLSYYGFFFTSSRIKCATSLSIMASPHYVDRLIDEVFDKQKIILKNT